MRQAFSKLALLFVLCTPLMAQKINPATQVNWPSSCITGYVYSPFSNLCVANGSTSIILTGAQYLLPTYTTNPSGTTVGPGFNDPNYGPLRTDSSGGLTIPGMANLFGGALFFGNVQIVDDGARSVHGSFTMNGNGGFSVGGNGAITFNGNGGYTINTQNTNGGAGLIINAAANGDCLTGLFSFNCGMLMQTPTAFTYPALFTQPIGAGNGVDAIVSPYSIEYTDGSPGATAGLLMCLDSSGDAEDCPTSTDHWSGITTGATPFSLDEVVAIAGVAPCTFDGTPVIGHFVQPSSTTAGECHDTGSTTPPTSGVLVGTVGTSETVNLFSPGITAGGGGGGSGTVTTVSVASANGFAGTVANPTTTPAITLTTTVTGLLKGNGTSVSAAAFGDIVHLWASGSCTGYLFSDGTCSTPSGGGNVSNTGTPTSGQLAVWLNATTIQGLTTLPTAAEPAHTGDVTNTAGSLAMTLATVNSNVGTCGDASHVGKVTLNAKGLTTACTAVPITGGAVAPNTYIFAAGVNGAVCDDSTDDTSALNALLTTASTAGGGTIQVYGTCLISGQINIPNNGSGTNPTQASIRITGGGGSANGFWLSAFQSPSVLDMRFTATYGKILTLAAGRLEIDHLTLQDGGSDCTPFIYTTSTMLAVHDVLFSGTASGTSACNDAVILGGTTTTTGTLAPTDAFQGYGTYIQHNFFDKIRRGAYFQTYAQGVTFKDNTFSASCGSTSSAAAVQLNADSGSNTVDANVFSGNLYETTHYPYVIWVGSDGNQFSGETFWDATGTTLFIFHFTGGANNNTASVWRDGSISSAILTDSNQPSGSNAVIDQTWQTGVGLAAIQGRVCSDTSGSGTSQTCTTAVAFTPAVGSWVIYKTTTANTGTGLTVSINGVSASVAKWQNDTTLAAGDVQAGATIPLIYDGTNWEMGAIGNPPSGSGGIANIQITVAAGSISATCSANTAATPTMTGLLTTSAVTFTPTSDLSSVSGWSNGDVYFSPWVAAGVLHYRVCTTNSSGETVASSTWNVGAK